MDRYVVVEGPIEDEAFFADLKVKDERVEVIPQDHFEGAQGVLQVVVPLSAGLTPLIVAYFRDKTARAKARVFVKDGKKVRLAGYTAAEIEQILKADES
ncbi:hypothetical protein GCM10010304_81420 [Streptomyces roseoviolaceus]